MLMYTAHSVLYTYIHRLSHTSITCHTHTHTHQHTHTLTHTHTHHHTHTHTHTPTHKHTHASYLRTNKRMRIHDLSEVFNTEYVYREMLLQMLHSAFKH